MGDSFRGDQIALIPITGGSSKSVMPLINVESYIEKYCEKPFTRRSVEIDSTGNIVE